VDTSPRADAGHEPLAVPMRRWRTRLSSAHILIFAAGALAFVANLALLRPDAAPPAIAVAATELLPGTVLDFARDVEFVPMSTEPSVLAEFVSEARVDQFDGHLLTERVAKGVPLRVADLTAHSDGDRRIMSLPLDRSRAVGGRLAAGDVVDVIVVDHGDARFIATGIEVVGVPDGSGGSFAGSSSYHLVLAVDSQTALDLSAAAEAATVQVIRSTGSGQR
jgi:Flp pilus assembly protein CpaB